MKISLSQLQLLDTIDRLGSFAAAAEALHKAKSAITYTVRQMEQQLAIAVFDRSGHRATLTEAGQLLLNEGRKILHDVNDLETKVHAMNNGWESKLRIAYDEAIAFQTLLPAIQDFYQDCPNTNLYLHAEALGGCWDALVHGRADLAIGVSGLMPGREDYSFQNIGTLSFAFAVATHHPLSQAEQPLLAEDINRYPAVYLMDSARRLPEQSYDVQSSKRFIFVNHLHEKIEAIRHGIGIGYLPEHLAQAAQQRQEIIIKQTQIQRPSACLSAAHRQQDRPNKAIAWWLKRIKQQAKDNRWLSL